MIGCARIALDGVAAVEEGVDVARIHIHIVESLEDIARVYAGVVFVPRAVLTTMEGEPIWKTFQLI